MSSLGPRSRFLNGSTHCPKYRFEGGGNYFIRHFFVEGFWAKWGLLTFLAYASHCSFLWKNLRTRCYLSWSNLICFQLWGPLRRGSRCWPQGHGAHRAPGGQGAHGVPLDRGAEGENGPHWGHAAARPDGRRPAAGRQQPGNIGKCRQICKGFWITTDV